MKNLILTTTLVLVAVSAHGALVVESAMPGSPAAAAGLQADDHILRLDGQKITTLDDLERVMAAHQPGDSVSLAVERQGETVDLTLIFTERSGGGVSMGVRLYILDGPNDASEPTAGTVACLAWVDETYRIDAMMQNLGLELSATYATIRACIERDTRRMSSTRAIKYCDNVFKVHCAGLDLITEIGEAHIERCAERFKESLGLRLEQYPSWKTCAQHKVFDRYATVGEADEETCRTMLLEECGTNLDARLETGQMTPEQQDFIACCSTDALGPEAPVDTDSGDASPCRMIDDGFLRGPCHDRSLCINRVTSEWIHCSMLGESQP